ncbi:hypothetical protein V1478_010089 [Vespula squamosa]|uniref:Uncharacterized protein n=1 Tax=Vespula squamosa TaxID=30214 RepID=A0ABD2AIQ9_VESSQ
MCIERPTKMFPADIPLSCTDLPSRSPPKLYQLSWIFSYAPFKTQLYTIFITTRLLSRTIHPVVSFLHLGQLELMTTTCSLDFNEQSQHSRLQRFIVALSNRIYNEEDGIREGIRNESSSSWIILDFTLNFDTPMDLDFFDGKGKIVKNRITTCEL